MVNGTFDRLRAGKAHVPEAAWGVFEATGPTPRAIQDTWKRISTGWLLPSGWEHTEGAQLRIYVPGHSSGPDYLSEVRSP